MTKLYARDARFYGIIIKLFFGDHPPPHFHAVYGEYVEVFDIDTLEGRSTDSGEETSFWNGQK